MTWKNSIPLATANFLLKPLNVEVKEESKGIFMAQHPSRPEDVIRETRITALFLQIMETWVKLI